MCEWMCDRPNCSNMVEVGDDYEPKGCCSGFECGCMGMVINPVFCDECESQLTSELPESPNG